MGTHFFLGLFLFLMFRAFRFTPLPAMGAVLMLGALKEIVFYFGLIFHSGDDFTWIGNLVLLIAGAGMGWGAMIALPRLRNRRDIVAEKELISARKLPQEQFIAIGDIHCQAGLLRKLLERIEKEHLTPHTSVIFLGDYLDRSKSKQECEETFELLRDFSSRFRKQVFFLRGNHEANFIDKETNGIDQINDIQDYELEIYRQNKDFIFSTFSYYENDEYFFSHAGGVFPDGTFARSERTEAEQKALFWQYQLPDKNYEKTVIRGHQIVSPSEMFGKYVINADLGSYKTNRLGAVVLPSRTSIIVEEKDD